MNLLDQLQAFSALCTSEDQSPQGAVLEASQFTSSQSVYFHIGEPAPASLRAPHSFPWIPNN